MDKNLNNLLKWSIEHTAPSESSAVTAVTSADSPAQTTTAAVLSGGDPSAPTDGGASAPTQTHRPIDPNVLNALFGGPSEAELMKAAIEVISAPDVELDQKLTAFDNFEQMIESLDNANNLEPLALWTPLLGLLEHEEAELRKMAAWCVGTAVQNNAKTQERLLAMGGLPKLVKVATDGGEIEAVRRKAVYALSSAVRNYQPAMDAVAEELHRNGVDGHQDGKKQVDAADMDAVDGIITALREGLKK